MTGRTRPAGGSTRGPFVRPGVTAAKHRARFIGLGRDASALPLLGLGRIPHTRVNPGGRNRLRDRAAAAREGTRHEFANGRCSYRVVH